MFSTTIVGHVKNVFTISLATRYKYFINAHIRSCNLFHRHATTSIIVQCCSDMKEMTVAILLLLGLLCWPLVNSQTFPYVSFMGQTLDNHSYVDLSLVGRPDSYPAGEGVQCITDLSTCCTNTDGSHRGDWYFPNGTRLPFAGSGDIFENREVQRVEIRRNLHANSPTGNLNNNSPVGIYHCDIPTDAVHDDTDKSVRDTVYVGLYTASGGMFYNNTATHKCIHICRRFVYMDVCNNSVVKMAPTLPGLLPPSPLRITRA